MGPVNKNRLKNSMISGERRKTVHRDIVKKGKGSGRWK
jgi:hypothetical protein